jgi:parvulin-like peptidyl-prolyl isomerase
MRVLSCRLTWTMLLAAALTWLLIQGPVWGQQGKPAKKAGAKPAAASSDKPQADDPQSRKLEIMAVVNGEPITREDLARDCLRQYGEEVLESLVNKQLIVEHCKAHNIGVSRKEVEAEIDRMAERFGLPTDQWLKLLQEERHITPTQYAKDIIWPTLALRKLAGERLNISKEEIQQAYESQYGPAVQARLIVCSNRKRAEQIRAQALKNPEDFATLAKQHSEDVASASSGGFIQPIRKHVGDAALEQAAFALRPGEVSEVLKLGDQYVILKCESHIPPTRKPLEEVRQALEDTIRDRKLREVSDELFRELQAQARVENIFNDPAKRKKYPGVAAMINDHRITIATLAEECIERHGVEVLESMINRRLLEQALARQRIEITRQDLDDEVARTALAMGKVRAGNEPDVEAWLAQLEREEGLTRAMYEHDVVWPVVALKKLVGDSVQVTEEDLQKGYEANYGPRVRCRAIVLNQQRRAQEVWELARKNPTAENFGNLAEKYSVEASSRSLRGEIPPIQRYGGQPQIEKEAFSLQPGELSSIIQVGDKFVILFCEGYTEPTRFEFDEVRDLIYEDLYEKKLRLAMAQKFHALQDAAEIDNFLTGSSQQPRGQKLEEITQEQPSSPRKSTKTASKPKKQ